MDTESLRTLMCGVEAIINGRRVTSASDDPNDLDVLIPSHLLLLRLENAMPPGVFKREDCYTRRKWRQVQYLADIFWKRWTREYLPMLKKRKKWPEAKRNIPVGHIVIIKD